MWFEVFTVPFLGSYSKHQDSDEWVWVVRTAAPVTEGVSGE